jgi:hypothetical protein
MPDKDLQVLRARCGTPIELRKGQTLKIINTSGSQVLDTWAFNWQDMSEYMSMEHTRSYNSRITPAVGDALVSNRYRPMLLVVADSSPGVHDTLMCSCSRQIYERMGVEGYHDNCEDNLHEALRSIGRSFPTTPGPLNLFMNFPVSPSGEITREPPVSRPGDFISLRAEMDVCVVISACPQDLSPVNGALRQPTDAHYQIL